MALLEATTINKVTVRQDDVIDGLYVEFSILGPERVWKACGLNKNEVVDALEILPSINLNNTNCEHGSPLTEKQQGLLDKVKSVEQILRAAYWVLDSQQAAIGHEIPIWSLMPYAREFDLYSAPPELSNNPCQPAYFDL